MANGRFQANLHRYCKRNNKTPEELSEHEMMSLALKSMPKSKLLSHGARALKTKAETKFSLNVVPDNVYEERKRRCVECPNSVFNNKDKILTCILCGCTGSLMDGALRHPLESCRIDLESEKKWNHFIDENNTGL